MISCPRTSHDTIQVLVSGFLALLTLPGCSGAIVHGVYRSLRKAGLR